MKLTQSILCCALATGLMVVAANQANAGVVIGNTLYSPLKIKLTVSAYNKNGKISKVSITSKEVLKMANAPKGSQLAIDSGVSNSDQIYIITKDAVVENLTAQGYLTANLSEYLSNGTEKKNGGFSYSESGVISLNFYSSPQFFSVGAVVPNIIINPVDQSASRFASSYWFEISGLYSYSENGSAINSKNGDQTINNKLTTGAMSGTGYDIDLDPSSSTVSGEASAKGDGKIVVNTQ
jgi:hypothetical protein